MNDYPAENPDAESKRQSAAERFLGLPPGEQYPNTPPRTAQDEDDDHWPDEADVPPDYDQDDVHKPHYDGLHRTWILQDVEYKQEEDAGDV